MMFSMKLLIKPDKMIKQAKFVTLEKCTLKSLLTIDYC